MLDANKTQRQFECMNGSIVLVLRRKLVAQVLLLGFAFFNVGSASAQNLINNPSFNDPISTNSSVLTNWTVAYVYGGREDFAVADRTTWSKRTFGIIDTNGVAWGAQFRPRTEGYVTAYFKQTVPNLLAGTNYVVSGYMATPVVYPWNDIFIEVAGGYPSTVTVRTPPCADGGTGNNPPYVNLYSVTNTAKANGTIEVRLRMTKTQNTIDKDYTCSACWDDISVVRQ